MCLCNTMTPSEVFRGQGVKVDQKATNVVSAKSGCLKELADQRWPLYTDKSYRKRWGSRIDVHSGKQRGDLQRYSPDSSTGALEITAQNNRNTAISKVFKTFIIIICLKNAGDRQTCYTTFQQLSGYGSYSSTRDREFDLMARRSNDLKFVARLPCPVFSQL